MNNKRKSKKNGMNKTFSVVAASSVVISAVPPNALANITPIGGTPAAWPGDAGTTYNFAAYTYSDGLTIFDPAEEPGISPDDVDFTSGPDKGAGNLPSYYITTNGTHMFFRVRVKGDPYDRKGGFLSSVWQVQLGVNGVHTATIGVNGKPTDEDYVYTADANGGNVQYIYKTKSGSNTVEGTRIVNAENGQYFIDFQVPISVLGQYGITSSSQIQLNFATSKSANLAVVNKDGKESTPFTGKKIITPGNLNPPLSISQIMIDGGDAVSVKTATPNITGTSIGENSSYKVTLEIYQGTTRVHVSTNNGVIFNTATGTWSYAVPSTANLTSGVYRIKAILEKGNSVVSTDEQILTVILGDTTTSVNITSIEGIEPALPTVKGTAEAGAKVEVIVDDVVVGVVTADSTGNWSYQLEKPLSAGTHQIKARATDNAGNQATTPIQNYTVTAISINIDNGDAVTTSDNQPTIRGTSNAPDGSLVTIKIGSETFTNAATVTGGKWRFEYPRGTDLQNKLADGTYIVIATVLGASDTQILTIDTTPPTVSITSPVHNSTIRAVRPEINGKSEPYATITLTIDSGAKVASVTADANGYWRYLVDYDLSLAAHTVRVKATDASGNESSEVSSTFTIVASQADQIPTATPVLSGTLRVGETLTASSGYFDANGDPELGTTFAFYSYDSNGNGETLVQAASTTNTYVLKASDVGKIIKVKVIPKNSLATGNVAVSAATGVILGVDRLPTATPTISGTLTVGSTLTASSGYADADNDPESGTLYAFFSYNSDGTGETQIQGASTTNTYVLQSVDRGKIIRVKVVPKNANGTGAMATSAATGVIDQLPTAVPTLTGTLQEGETLTATSGYSDLDRDIESGTTYAFYSYNSDETGEILIQAASTTNTYILKATDVGKVIKVKVIPMNTKGAGAEAVSTATGVIIAAPQGDRKPTASPTLTGTLEVGKTLTATSGYQDEDGDAEAGTTYAFYRADENGMNEVQVQAASTGNTYTIQNADIGKKIIVKVVPKNAKATGDLVSASTSVLIVDQKPTATPTLTGDLKVGSVLTATSGYNDADGDVEAGTTYAFYRVDADGKNEFEVRAASTENTYTIQNGDIGKKIIVKVVPKNARDTGTEVSASTSGLIADQKPTATPTLTGDLKVGSVLTATSGYNDADGDVEAGTTYAFYRVDADGKNEVEVQAASTDNTYTIQNGDIGKKIIVKVVPMNARAIGDMASASTSGTVGDQLPTAAPTLTGTLLVGETITATSGYSDLDGDAEKGTTYTFYSYDDEGNETLIQAESTNNTYVLKNEDIGKTIKVKVIPKNDRNTGLEAYSAATEKVVANEAPTATVMISGTAHVGEVLTGSYVYADTELDAQGTSTLQWYRGSKADGSDKEAIEGAKSAQYTLTSEDVNYYLFFEVTPKAQTGTLTGLPVVSAPSGKINAAPTATAVSISGTTKVGEKLTGVYTYGDVNGDLEGTSRFQWYRGSKTDGTDKVAITGANALEYTLTTADLGRSDASGQHGSARGK